MLLDRLAAAHIKELLNQEPLLAEVAGTLTADDHAALPLGRCSGLAAAAVRPFFDWTIPGGNRTTNPPA